MELQSFVQETAKCMQLYNCMKALGKLNENWVPTHAKRQLVYRLKERSIWIFFRNGLTQFCSPLNMKYKKQTISNSSEVSHSFTAYAQVGNAVFVDFLYQPILFGLPFLLFIVRSTVKLHWSPKCLLCKIKSPLNKIIYSLHVFHWQGLSVSILDLQQRDTFHNLNQTMESALWPHCTYLLWI